MMDYLDHRVTHLPLLSLLLGVMPEEVRRRETFRFEPVRGNLECAMWVPHQCWAKVSTGLKNRGFQFWIEEGERTIWCYGVGRIDTEETPMILTLLWETIESGQKVRLLFHDEPESPKLMVISKRDF